ncbi:hypothetical protein EDB86DRAFT_2985241, partial [Lactarius hatsudake]
MIPASLPCDSRRLAHCDSHHLHHISITTLAAVIPTATSPPPFESASSTLHIGIAVDLAAVVVCIIGVVVLRQLLCAMRDSVVSHSRRCGGQGAKAMAPWWCCPSAQGEWTVCNSNGSNTWKRAIDP